MISRKVKKYLLESKWGEDSIQVPMHSEVLCFERTDRGVYIHMLVTCRDIWDDDPSDPGEIVTRTFKPCDLSTYMEFGSESQYKYVGSVSSLDGGLLHYFERMH